MIQSFWWLIPLCLGAYLFGCINFSDICCRLFIKTDVRKLGSGNPGTTNMLRNFGFRWGMLILLLDWAKGGIPALAGLLLFGFSTDAGQIALFAMGLAAVLGHCFPVTARFRGGKGIATLIGVFIVANPWMSLAVFFIGLGYLAIFEYGAIVSLVFITAMMVFQAMTTEIHIAVAFLMFAFYCLVWVTHRTNIYRLLTGTENHASLFKRLLKKRNARKQKQWRNEIADL